MPVNGWWNEYVSFREKELPFSLIVTVRTPGIDIYTPVSLALQVPVQVTV
jgi:hypothetical protein